MDTKFFEKIEKKHFKSRVNIHIGDTVRLHLKIIEGEKERTQVFEGVVIAMKGQRLNKTITVRKLVSGVGVEKIVPLHSHLLQKIEVIKRGKPRRSKLYYMRERIGKKALGVPNAQAVYFADMEEKAKTEVTTEPDESEVAETKNTQEATESETEDSNEKNNETKGTTSPQDKDEK